MYIQVLNSWLLIVSTKVWWWKRYTQCFNIFMQILKKKKKEFAYLPTHTQSSWVGFGQTEIFLIVAQWNMLQVTQSWYSIVLQNKILTSITNKCLTWILHNPCKKKLNTAYTLLLSAPDLTLWFRTYMYRM